LYDGITSYFGHESNNRSYPTTSDTSCHVYPGNATRVNGV
jgi:hypothetical protein